MDFIVGLLLRISRDFIQVSPTHISMVLLQLVCELVRLKVVQESLCRLQHLQLKLSHILSRCKLRSFYIKQQMEFKEMIKITLHITEKHTARQKIKYTVKLQLNKYCKGNS